MPGDIVAMLVATGGGAWVTGEELKMERPMLFEQLIITGTHYIHPKDTGNLGRWNDNHQYSTLPFQKP